MRKIYFSLLSIFMLSISSLSAQNTDGRDFWLTFGKNWREDQPGTTVIPRIKIVTKDYITSGTIEFTNLPEGPNKRISFDNIPPRETREYPLNPIQKNACYLTLQGTSNLSIKITSNHPITAYALNQCDKSADATNILPEPTLGKDYYQISYPAQGYDDAYAVIATEDDTKVYHNDEVIPVATLNRGQVYYRTYSGSSWPTVPADMTGIHVTTSHNAAFFALCQGTYIKYSTSRDCLFQQLAPTNTWGYNFLVPVTNVFGNTTPDRVRIVASEDLTKVTRTGGTHISAPGGQTGPEYILNKGQFIELEVVYNTNGCFIEAEKPVGICTYLTTPQSTNGDSDPAQAWLPSKEQIAKIALIAPFNPPAGTSLTTHKALILAPTDTKNNTRVTIGTGAPTPLSGGEWRDNAASGMSFYNYQMSNADLSYRFNNPDGIIVMGYGYGPAESYYYLGYSSMLKLDAYFTANAGNSAVHYQNFSDELFCNNEFEFRAEFLEPENVLNLTWEIDNEIQSPLDPFNWTYTFPAGSAGPHLVKMVVEFSTGDQGTFEETMHIGAHITATPNPSDGSGGTVSPTDTCVKIDESVTFIATPNTPDYKFVDWSGGPNPSTNATYTFTVDDDRTLVANFELDVVAITTSEKPSIGGSTTGGGSYTIGSNATVTATANYGYHFVKWTTTSGDSITNVNSYTFEVTGALHLVAHFKLNPYPVTLSANPTTGGTYTGAGTYTHGDIVPITAQNADCYTFFNWTNTKGEVVSNSASFTFVIVNDTSLTANFTLNHYPITLSASPLIGANTFSGGDTNFPCGEDITVTATADPCYTFKNWTTPSGAFVSNDNPYTFTVTEARDLIANFDIILYNVTVSPDPEVGYNAATGSATDIDCGTSVTVTAIADDCYDFVKWTTESGDSVTNVNPYTFTVTQDSVLFAVFQVKTYNVTLSLSVNPPGSGTTSGGGIIPCEEFATVKAVADSCHTFVNWTVGGVEVSTDNPYRFMVTGDRIFVANFERKAYDVFVSADPPAGGTPAGDNTYNCGDLVTLNANTDECYNFINWTLDGNEVSTDEDYTFTITGENTLATIGTGAGTTTQIPVNTLFDYSYSQQIFEASEITLSPGASITSLAFEYIRTTPYPTHQNIYIGHTAMSSFSSTSDYIPLSAMQLVYSGSYQYNNSQKWSTITLAVPFIYTGNNLVIAIANTSGFSTFSSAASFTTHAAPNKTIHYASNISSINLTNPLAGSQSSGVLNVRNNCQLRSLETTEFSYMAHFTIKPYNISVSASPTGGGAVTGGGTDINCGTSIPLTAVADPCYTFVNWTDRHGTVVSTSPNFTLTVNNDSTLTANFTIKTYSINLSMNPASGAGTVTGGGTYDCGASVTITAVPDFCYTFVNWTEGGVPVPGAGASCTFTVGGHRNLTANFRIKKFDVAVSKNTPANNTVLKNYTDISCGDSVSITAIPDVFHTFVEWTDTLGVFVSSGASAWITVKSDTSLIAHFIPKTYTINVSASSTPGGNASGGGTDIPYNTVWTVTANPTAPLYKFSHWEDYGTKVEDAGAVYTFPVTGDRDLVAVFAKETVIIKVIAEPDTGGMAYQSAYKVALDSLCYVWATPSLCSHFTKWTTLDNTVLTPSPTYWFTVYPLLYPHIIDSVITLVAHFNLNSYEINLEPSPPHGGDVYLNGDIFGEGSFPCGTEVEIRAKANSPKYKFVEWVEVNGTDTARVSNNPIYKFNVRESRSLVALFELEMYEITVLPNPVEGGIAWGGGFFPYDSVITVHADPYPEWTFFNWTENGIPCSPSKDFEFTVTRDRTLYANFIPKTFTVKVTASPPDGGWVTENGTGIDYGALWEITAKPKPTYEFSHWEENGTVYPLWADEHTISVIRDFDLTAVFVLKQYEITLESDPSIGGELLGGGTYEHGTEIEVEAIAGDCHTFSHWTENDVTVCSNPVFPFTVTGPRHLVAHFTPTMHDITLISDPTGGGTFIGGGPQPCLAETVVWAIPDPCYDFINWTENGKEVCTTPDYTFTVVEPRELVANFVRKTFSITTSVSPVVAPPGSGATLGDEKDIPCGEERTATAIPETGYVFVNWTKDGDEVSTNPAYTFTVMEDNDLVAHFIYTEHNIILFEDPYGSGQAITSGSYPHGLELTVHAIPHPEYVFVEWTEDDISIPGAGAQYTFIVDRPRTLTAHFDTATFTVTTAPDPLDGGDTWGNDTDIPYGTMITVTAEAKECFIFDYWTIDGVWKWDEPEYTFPVTQSCHVVAHFKPKTFNIILERNPVIGGQTYFMSEGGGYNIPCGDSITILAAPFSNYEFVNWTRKEDGVQVSGNAIHEFSVTQSDTLTANFKLKAYDVILSVSPGGGTVWDNHYNVPHGEEIEIHAKADDGYRFLYWTEYGETDIFSPYPEPAAFPVNNSMHLVAHFELETFDIIPRANPHYGGTVWDTAYNVAYGTYYEVHAQEKPFFTFAGWFEDGAPASPLRDYPFTVLGSRSLEARFTTVSFEIEVSANPPAPTGGTVGGAGEYDYGMTIPITAKADTCYDFVGWYENDIFLNSDNPFLFTVDGPHHFVAHFVQKLFTITTAETPSGSGVTTGGDTGIPCREERTIEAFAGTGYVFQYWTVCGTVIYDNPYTFEVMESCEATAHFIYVEHNIELVAVPYIGGWAQTGGAYPHGMELAVHAIPKPGYRFLYWMESDTVISGADADYLFTVDHPRHLEAHFDSATYTVTTAPSPKHGGITFPEDTTGLAYNAPLTVTAVANENFTFAYWMENNTPIPAAEDVYPFSVTRDRDLVAVFEPQKFNITIRVNPPGSGEAGDGGNNIPYGDTISLWAQPFDNYIFVNWTDENGEINADPSFLYVVQETKQLTANFKPKGYNITLDVSPGGTGTVSGGGLNIPYGTIDTVRAVPNENHTFAGWYENEALIPGAPAVYIFAVTGNRHLVAHFDPTNYNIVISPDDSERGWVEGGGYNIPFGTDTSVMAHPYLNYDFAGWWEGNELRESDPFFPITVTRNMDMVAKFTPKNYNIRVYATPSGYGKATGGGDNLPYGSETTVVAEANRGYVFKGWYEDGTCVNYNPEWKFKITRSRDLTAVFEVEKYTVTLLANPEEGGKVWGGGTDFTHGEEITVYASANKYYYFRDWTDENGAVISSDTSHTFNVIESCILTANFTAITSKITLLANPPQGGTLSGGGEIPQGKTITVTASPNTGYSFISWTEGETVLSADTDYTLTVDENDRTLVANFEFKAYNINLSASPAQGGTVSGGGEIPQGTQITVSATRNECYSFVNWTENGMEVSTEADYTFIVDRDRDLTAHFVQNTFTITASANPPEYGTVEGGKDNVPCKQEITVTATPLVGYLFVNWTKEGIAVSTDSVYTFPATESCELVANFDENIQTVTLVANPPELGAVAGAGSFLYGTPVTASATPYSGYSFINWTENAMEVSTEADYAFTVTRSRTLVANFEKTYYTVTVVSNDTLYGIATLYGHPTGTGKFEANETATAIASVKQGYRFLNWTVNDTIVHWQNVFEFPVTRNVTVVANFYGLDFDTYAATLWDNTFMLDLKKLADEEYDITACKWFKNSREEKNTNTINEFSYSAGPKITDKLELDPTYYYFQLTTGNGSVLYSTKKVLPYHQFYQPPPNDNLFVYPNPASSASAFTVENATKGTLMQVYNQYGVCVKSFTAHDNSITVSLNLPAGVYLIRNDGKDAKVVIVK